MIATHSAERRLLQLLAGIAAIAIVGVLLILPYRLYSRDIRRATIEAHRISAVLHTAIGHALIEGENVSELVNHFQSIADLQVNLRRLDPDEVHPAAQSSRGSSSRDSFLGTDLTYTAAPILDRQGRTWLAQMNFDLSRMKRESVRLIIDLVLATVIGSALFSVLVFWIVRAFLIVPLRRATRILERHDPAVEVVEMPTFSSREMSALASAVENACRAHHEAR